MMRRGATVSTGGGGGASTTGSGTGGAAATTGLGGRVPAGGAGGALITTVPEGTLEAMAGATTTGAAGRACGTMRRPVVCGAEDGRSDENVSVGITGWVLGARDKIAARCGGTVVTAGRASTGGDIVGRDTTGATVVAWGAPARGASVGLAGVATIGAGAGASIAGLAACVGGRATTTGGAGAAGGGITATTGRAGAPLWPAASAFLRSRMARAISPGLVAFDRSNLGRFSAAGADDREAEPPVKWRRTSSASPTSMELECVFFSETPTAVRASRMDLLLTSSSRARSLMRTLLNQSSICSPALQRVIEAPRKRVSRSVQLLSPENGNNGLFPVEETTWMAYSLTTVVPLRVNSFV